MVDTKILKPGDRVRIVDRWPADGSAVQNPEGKMDHWLGQTMTVKYVGLCTVAMCEDDGERYGGGWAWYPGAIACVVEGTNFSPASESDFLGLLSS